MNGIQTTTSEGFIQGKHLVGPTQKNTLTFQSFLQGYTQGLLKTEQSNPIIIEEGMALSETLEKEELKLEEEVAEGQVIETSEQPVLTLEEVVSPEVQVMHPTFLSNDIESMNDPRHFQLTQTAIGTGEEGNLGTVSEVETTGGTATASLFAEKNVASSALSNQSSAPSVQGTPEIPLNGAPATEEVVTTAVTGSDSLAKPTEAPTIERSTTAIQKIEWQPQKLENQTTTAIVNIPPQMLPQEGTQKVAEVSPAMLEKMSQPIIEKVTTMNGPGTQKMTVELLPEKLGKMEITIKVTDQKIQLEFVVENTQTKQLLESISTKLERVLNKQEFPQITQGKVTEATPVTTELQGDMAFFDQSAFQQGFQREQSEQSRFGKGSNSKSFAEIALEKIEETPGDGSIDLLV